MSKCRRRISEIRPPPRFAGEDNASPTPFKPSGEEADLGRLSDAVGPFEGDENALFAHRMIVSKCALCAGGASSGRDNRKNTCNFNHTNPRS